MQEPDAISPVGRVHVVEDDAAVRDALCTLLEVNGYRVQAYPSAEVFMETAVLDRPACAVVDLRLPGCSGLDLQQSLNDKGEGLPFVMITAHGDVASARTALLGGAVDFIEKPIEDADLLVAVRNALALDANALHREQQDRSAVSHFERLTAREREVFMRITDGLHNREVAVELGISPRTVEVFRAKLMDKLGARRVSDLFRLRFALDGANVGEKAAAAVNAR